MKFNNIKITLIMFMMIFLFGINASSQTDTEADEDLVTYRGTVQIGKTDSVILYFGEESGDYAAFCFMNKSDIGKVILSICKDGEQCEFTGKLADSACEVKGLEADLSSSGKIVSLKSVKLITVENKPVLEPLQCTVVTKGGNLNVRDLDGKVIGKLKNNASVYINEESDNGRSNISVRRNGKLVVFGWVSSKYLSCSGD